MGDEVVGVRMEDNRGGWRWRVVHTNVAREMPMGHERGKGR